MCSVVKYFYDSPQVFYSKVQSENLYMTGSLAAGARDICFPGEGTHKAKDIGPAKNGLCPSKNRFDRGQLGPPAGKLF